MPSTLLPGRMILWKWELIFAAAIRNSEIKFVQFLRDAADAVDWKFYQLEN